MFGIWYLVIDSQAPYHMILESLSLNTLGAIVSTPHLALKFPISDFTYWSWSHTCQLKAWKCYHESVRKKEKRNQEKEKHRKSTWSKLVNLGKWTWGTWTLEKKEGRDQSPMMSSKKFKLEWCSRSLHSLDKNYRKLWKLNSQIC